MPFNLPGILVPIQLLIHPRLVIPALSVKDIRQIDFVALKNAGYRGAVFDKDNCLTLPHKDTLVPELQESWKLCLETFGHGHVLIVSNSAGTHLDPGGLQSESVMYHLGAPVLNHKTFKPGYSCIRAIRLYFSSLRSPILDHEIIVVGDRIFTDVVLANRMRLQTIRRQKTGLVMSNSATATVPEKLDSGETSMPKGPLAIWTTGVWKRESMAMRLMERGMKNAVERWSKPPVDDPVDFKSFAMPEPIPVEKPSIFQNFVSWFR